MKIHIKSFANFRDILGRDFDVDLEHGSTVEDLLQNLVASNQRLKSAIFDDADKINEHVILMKNRKNIDRLEGLRTGLTEGDEVAILPPVTGG
jgi:sulfur-carrier protein